MKKKSIKSIQKTISKISSVNALDKLFSNDYLPKDIFDSLVSLYIIAALNRSGHSRVLQSLLSHPHCSEETVKSLLIHSDKVCGGLDSDDATGIARYKAKAISLFLIEITSFHKEIVLANIDLIPPAILDLVRSSTYSDQSAKAILEGIPKRKKVARVSDLLVNLEEALKEIKENPALYLLDKTTKIREFTEQTLKVSSNQ